LNISDHLSSKDGLSLRLTSPAPYVQSAHT
jgi:hypothetical protein